MRSIFQTRSQALPGNALSRRLCLLVAPRGRASQALRSQAEPGNERSWRLLVAALAVALSAHPASLAAQDRLAIKGGRILPVAGPPIENGVILITKGKIKSVGKDSAIPAGVKVIDATGKVVVPGFIEAHSTRGMDQVNETNPNVPFLSVIDAIDPSQDYFEECRRNGVTTAAVVPGNNTMFGGQAAVLKTAGEFVDQMVIKRGVGLKISLKPATDRNRMGHVATIRKEPDNA